VIEFVIRKSFSPASRRPVLFLLYFRTTGHPKEYDAYMRLATQSQGFFNFVRNFHLVNDRLARVGIPFYWGNLEQFSRTMLEPYLPLGGFVGRLAWLDLARDARHGGPQSHIHFANTVLSLVERNKLAAKGDSG
jgi:hypothetical protein